MYITRYVYDFHMHFHTVHRGLENMEMEIGNRQRYGLSRSIFQP